jgi:hypothetical protein
MALFLELLKMNTPQIQFIINMGIMAHSILLYRYLTNMEITEVIIRPSLHLTDMHQNPQVYMIAVEIFMGFYL